MTFVLISTASGLEWLIHSKGADTAAMVKKERQGQPKTAAFKAVTAY